MQISNHQPTDLSPILSTNCAISLTHHLVAHTLFFPAIFWNSSAHIEFNSTANTNVDKMIYLTYYWYFWYHHAKDTLKSDYCASGCVPSRVSLCLWDFIGRWAVLFIGFGVSSHLNQLSTRLGSCSAIEVSCHGNLSWIASRYLCGTVFRS